MTLTESLRIELAAHGVHAGVVYLGFTEHDPEKRILAADGQDVRPDRPAHHTQDEAAAHILRMIERRKIWRRTPGRGGTDSHFESRWKPKSWERKARFVFMRSRAKTVNST